MGNAVRVQRSPRLIILRERLQVPHKNRQGRLEAHITNTIRGNNKEVVGDCVEAFGDCIGTARLCGYWGGCAEELELAIICMKLHRSLHGCTDSSEVTP